MERKTSLEEAKEIMGKNFIGPNQLKMIEKEMGIFVPLEIIESPPAINYKSDFLKKNKDDYILILGIPFFKDKSPLTIVKMRDHFGWDPNISEPCFYNQDWYLNEDFANEVSFDLTWSLIRKSVFEEYRGISFLEIYSELDLPKAVLCVYVFFCYYFVCGDLLFQNDYTWCCDQDSFGDSIYVGRYLKTGNINKNGFEIHRHLSVKSFYSSINVI